MREEGDLRCLDVGATAADHLERGATHEPQDHRDVMRRKAPEDVLLAPDLPQVEPVRVEVEDLPELTAREQLADPPDRRVVLEHVADEEDPLALAGQPDELRCVLLAESQRPLDEDVFPRF